MCWRCRSIHLCTEQFLRLSSVCRLPMEGPEKKVAIYSEKSVLCNKVSSNNLLQLMKNEAVSRWEKRTNLLTLLTASAEIPFLLCSTEMSLIVLRTQIGKMRTTGRLLPIVSKADTSKQNDSARWNKPKETLVKQFIISPRLALSSLRCAGRCHIYKVNAERAVSRWIDHLFFSLSGAWDRSAPVSRHVYSSFYDSQSKRGDRGLITS